jgi:tRNA pseudouridine38-40 synthase
MLSELPTQRIALILQYGGAGFCGWQRQPKGRSVQSVLEDAIAKAAGHPVVVHGAGRTDTGVHAAAQVAHFDSHSPIPADRWMGVLNSRLPDDMIVRASAQVPDDWHACFSASWRRYRYTIYTDACPNLFLKPYVWHYYRNALAVDRMRSALEPLLGRHHLSAFRRAGSSRPHSWVDVQEVVCQRRGDFIEIEVQASGFLYGMMRLLVGMLVQVGEGERSIASFTEIWQREQRHLVLHSAPAKGLCLLRVGYPQTPFSESVWFDTQPRFLLPELLENPVTRNEPVLS